MREAGKRYYPEDVRIIAPEVVRRFLGRSITVEDLDRMAAHKTFVSRADHLYYEAHGTLDTAKVRENGKAEEGSVPVGDLQDLPS